MQKVFYSIENLPVRSDSDQLEIQKDVETTPPALRCAVLRCARVRATAATARTDCSLLHY
jgi:hypothetical protein